MTAEPKPRRAAPDQARTIPYRYLPIAEQALVNHVLRGGRIILNGVDTTDVYRKEATRIARDYDRLMRQLADERGRR